MTDDRLLNFEQVAQILGVKPRTVYDYVARYEIPFLRVGRLLRFDRQVILDWVTAKIKKNAVKE